MADTSKHDTWAQGDAYEPYVGRWSRKIAPEFIAWLNVIKEKRWLDVGCGTGALCAAIVDRLTFGGNIIETGTESYRLRSTRPRRTRGAKSSEHGGANPG